MKSPGKIRIVFYLLAFVGAALFTLLLIREGAPQIGKAVATAGWAILAVIAYHFLVPVLLDALDRRISQHAGAVGCGWGRSCSCTFSGDQRQLGGDGCRDSAGRSYTRCVYASRVYPAWSRPPGERDWSEEFCRPDADWNYCRGCGCLRFLFCPTARDVPVPRANDCATREFPRMALASSERRGVGSNHPIALCATPRGHRVLWLDDSLARSQFRRNLDRALGAESSRHGRERNHSAKHGFDHSRSGVPGSRGIGRAGKWLCSGRQSSGHSR